MRGGCLCGRIRYRLADRPTLVANCHCSMCRKHSGAAFLTYAAIDSAAFALESGEPTRYRSSADAIRTHCGACGSPLTFEFESEPGRIWVTAGSLDEPDALPPAENWFVADKVAWVEVDEKLKNWHGPPQ